MQSVPLSDDELARAALGPRALAFMHERKAQDGEHRELHAEQVRRFRALAERFENARTHTGGVRMIRRRSRYDSMAAISEVT